jgi:endonuclease-3
LSAQKPLIPDLLKLLWQEYPAPLCALHHENPLQLLVATILSAQCTDERVNLVTKTLFLRYRTAADFAGASQQALEKAVHSTGFFRNKAKNLRGACLKILEEFGGQVPNSMDALLSLPGVARKTANVVLGTAFGIAAGVVVDTHVLRLSRRLELTKETSPEKVEKDLMRLLPRTEWIDFSHRLIQHGRRVCSARKPACAKCALERLCPKNGVEPVVGEVAK